jgi:putative addiction module killer protein
MPDGSTACVTGKPGRASMCVSVAFRLGNPGDVKHLGEGVSELRIDYGPGYRVYFVQRGQTLIILLAGGDKHTQDQDIKTARELAQGL